MCNYLNYSEHNCEFLACSEIRAANLSGQCNAFRRWEELGWVDQRECVEMRAKKKYGSVSRMQSKCCKKCVEILLC